MNDRLLFGHDVIASRDEFWHRVQVMRKVGS
jgi:hypothetical protein